MTGNSTRRPGSREGPDGARPPTGARKAPASRGEEMPRRSPAVTGPSVPRSGGKSGGTTDLQVRPEPKGSLSSFPPGDGPPSLRHLPPCCGGCDKHICRIFYKGVYRNEKHRKDHGTDCQPVQGPGLHLSRERDLRRSGQLLGLRPPGRGAEKQRQAGLVEEVRPGEPL